jgi:predicted Zn finger-like uncharacterized protein
MLIVCPNCAASSMIDRAAVGPAGRKVRCARCKASWFAGGPESTPAVTSSVDTVIAETEAQSTPAARVKAPRPPAAAPPPTAQAASDVGSEDSESIIVTATKAPPVEPPPREPAPAPVEVQTPEAADAEPDSEEAESEVVSFDARRKWLQARRKQSRRPSRWTAVILVLVACNVALVDARSEVVRYLPQTASLFAAIGLPVNLRNLKFENVKILTEAQDGIDTVIVQGAIASEAGKPVAVPRLRFAARNSTG